MAWLGSMLVATVLHPDARGTQTGRAALKLALILIATQLIWELSETQVSSAGHLGGLMTGIGLGVLLLARRGPRDAPGRPE